MQSLNVIAEHKVRALHTFLFVPLLPLPILPVPVLPKIDESIFSVNSLKHFFK